MPRYQRPWRHADRRPEAPVEPPGLRPPNDGVTDWRHQGPAAEVLALEAAQVPKPPAPKLELPRIPQRDLERLIELEDERYVLRSLNVHEKTLYRWRTGRVPIPGRQHLAIKLLLGELPGTDGRWSGWRFSRGALVAPGGEAFQAGDVLSLGLLRQQLAAQRRELEQLQVKLAIAEHALQAYTGAANEDLRVRATGS